MMQSSCPRKIQGVEFDFYTKQELLSLASVEVTNLLAFDEFKNPISNGLYDPKMGVGPYDKFGKCPTCGKSEKSCQGHFGFIKLILPIYNLHLMRMLEKLLKIKCFKCHRILMKPAKAKEFTELFRLLQYGKIAEFLDLQELHNLRFFPKQKPKKVLKSSKQKKSFHSENTEDMTRKSDRSKSRDQSKHSDSEEEEESDHSLEIEREIDLKQQGNKICIYLYNVERVLTFLIICFKRVSV